LVGARFLKSVLCRQSSWENSLCKNTSINNTNCNPPPQTYCQLPTKICYHRALSLESAVNVCSVEGRCTDPASICFHKSGPSCAFVFIEVILDRIRQQGISSSTPRFPGSKTYKIFQHCSILLISAQYQSTMNGGTGGLC
jgi:hypothetical protein